MFLNASTLLVGTWREEGCLETYRADGTEIGQGDKGDSWVSKWSIEGDVLKRINTVQSGVTLDTPQTYYSKIISISESKYVLKDIGNGNRESRGTKVK